MSKKILVVDDDEELCEEITGILEAEGYAVSTVFDGSLAKPLIEKEGFDLIILDMKIPRIKGAEILKSIKEKNIPAKVMVWTGSPVVDKFLKKEPLNIQLEEEGALKLADAFIGKPFSVEAALKKIKELIG